MKNMRKNMMVTGLIPLAISAFLFFVLPTLLASRIEAAGARGRGLGFSLIGLLLLISGIILIIVGFILPQSKKEDNFRMGY